MRSNSRRKRRSNAPAVEQEVPRSARYKDLEHPFEPQSVFSDDAIHAIHETALRTLEKLGMKILLPEAREIFARAGAIVEDEMVKIGREIVSAALETAPKSFTQMAANPAHAITFETGKLLFKAGAGCPNVTDLERGRRPGALQDYEDALRLCQSFEVIHAFAPCVEPQDIPPNLRHYEVTRAQLALGDKPMFVYARGQAQVEQSFEMIQLALGLSDAEFAGDIWASTNINTNSPRMLDRPMAKGIIDFARAGQMTVVTPFCLAGAMAPVTVAGALTLQHAEALAGITLAQLSRAGAPVCYGGFSSNVDMKSGSPAFGTPEHVKLQLGSGQMARLIGLPWRSAAGSSSVANDMQAANENDMGLWGCLNSGTTLALHAAGWLEGGLSFGFEKFINDVEVLQSMAELCQPTAATPAEIGFDALQEVSPGGHFFAAAHTMERYRDAFYRPLVANLDNHGTWEASGACDSAERATRIWKDVLAQYKAPKGAEEREANVLPYIEKQSALGGAAPLD